MIRFLKKRFFTCHGSPIHVLYKPVVSDLGYIKLVESGKENTDDIIQSFRESTDIQIILSRVNAGDTEALNQRKSFYMDTTVLPKTYAEFLQMQIDSKRMFNSLDPDTRKKFDNDVNVFMSTSGTEEWLKKLGIEIPDANIKKGENTALDFNEPKAE